MNKKISEIGDRAKTIFKLLVENYISTGEPLGSKSISSKINNCLYILLDYGDSLGNQIFYCIKKLKRKDLAIEFIKQEYKKLKKNTDYKDYE